MSFREIRNLVEHLRVLGFPRMVSLENFSSPNFQLVSEILTWAMTTVDRDCSLSTNIDSQQDRVVLVRLASLFFYKKLGVHLSMVKLYGADKLSARELLKITHSLHKAAQSVLHPGIGREEELPVTSNCSGVASIKELREVRQLASSIIMDAASLCDCLQQEVDNKMMRLSSLTEALDLDSLEASVLAALHALASSVAEIKEATEHLVKEQKEIVEKIQKKKDSLIRNQKRLDALLKIKPAWQTEFDQEEAQLCSIWDKYIIKHKNLAYLEEQLEQLEKQQQLQKQVGTATMRDTEATTTYTSVSRATRSSVQETLGASCCIFGSMTGGNLESSEESDSVDSILVDSGSEGDSLTLMSAAGRVAPAPQQGSVVSLGELRGAPVLKTHPKDSLSLRPVSAQQSLTCSSSGPKLSQMGMRENSKTVWTSVKGSERVSPLSASEDCSDDAF